MTPIILPTIQHTGTHFVMKILKDAGYSHKNIMEEPEQNSYLVGHLDNKERTDRAIELMQAYPAIIPLRDEKAVMESWKKHGRKLSILTHCYRNLEKLLLYNPYILPLHDYKRQAALDLINKELNLSLTTDWEVVRP